MALDRDEMNKRRQRREAERQKRLRQQRQLRARLIVAAVVIVICAVAIFAISRNSGSETPEDVSTPTGMMVTEAPTEEVATTPPDEPVTTIHIKAAGDLNVTDLVVASGRGTLGYDFTAAFLDVAPLLSDADLTLMNFEGNLVGEPYGTDSGSAPQQLMDALDAAGVDILQMANSFSIYNGLIGLNQTLNNIRAAGIEPVGAFSSPEEFQKSKGYTICEVQGIKVAVVAFTKGMGSLGLPEGSESCVNKLYVDYDTTYQDVDSKGIREILRNVASERPDVTIAMLHWGAEYNDTIFDTQKQIVSLMQKEGVDIIIGTHPHMVHEVAFDDAKNTLVAYSLGDFFGDGTKGGTNYSIILDIEISRDNTNGTMEIEGFTYTPIYTLKENEGDGQRKVVRIDEAMAAYEVNFVDKVTKAAYDSMANALERIEARVDPVAWKAKQEALKAAEGEA